MFVYALILAYRMSSLVGEKWISVQCLSKMGSFSSDTYDVVLKFHNFIIQTVWISHFYCWSWYDINSNVNPIFAFCVLHGFPFHNLRSSYPILRFIVRLYALICFHSDFPDDKISISDLTARHRSAHMTIDFKHHFTRSFFGIHCISYLLLIGIYWYCICTVHGTCVRARIWAYPHQPYSHQNWFPGIYLSMHIG